MVRKRNKNLKIVGFFIVSLFIIVNVGTVIAEDQTVYQGLVTTGSVWGYAATLDVSSSLRSAGIEVVFFNPTEFDDDGHNKEEILEILDTKEQTSTYTSSSQLWSFEGYTETHIQRLDSSDSTEITSNDGDEVLLVYGETASGSDSLTIPVSGELEPVVPDDGDDEWEITTTKILSFWFNIGHSTTKGYDGAPCWGIQADDMSSPSTDKPSYEKLNYTDMYNLDGLTETFIFINSCNSFMDPWKSSIISNNPAAYIGGTILLPSPESDSVCKLFWQTYCNEYSQGNPATDFDDQNFHTFISNTLNDAITEVNVYAEWEMDSSNYGIWT